MSNQRINFKLSIVALLLLFVASNALIVLTDFLYWDDWLWFYLDKKNRLESGVELGAPLTAYLAELFYLFKNPTLLFRILVLVSTAVAAGGFTRVLYNMQLLSKKEAYYFFGLYLFLPIGVGVKYINSVSLYSFYIGIFAMASWLLLSFKDKLELWRRATALILFFLSFTLNSMLVLYAAVLLAFCVRLKNEFSGSVLSSCKVLCTKYLDIVLLPVVFWLVKSLYMSPSGFYASYNQLSAKHLFKATLLTPRTMGSMLRELLSLLFSVPGAFLVGVMLVVWIVYCLWDFYTKKKHKKYFLGATFLFVLGVFLLYLGIFPYEAVGRIPTFKVFTETRHTLASGLGVCLLMVGVLRSLQFSKVATNITFWGLVGASIISVNFTYIDMFRDGVYQTALVSHLHDNKGVISNYNILLVRNSVNNANYNNRPSSFYEYTGYVVKALREKKIYAVSYDSYAEYPVEDSRFTDPKFKARYNFPQFELEAPELVMDVSQVVSSSMGQHDVLPTADVVTRFIPMYFTSKNNFEQNAKGLLDIKFYEGMTAIGYFLSVSQKVTKALEKYFSDNGHYPVLLKGSKLSSRQVATEKSLKFYSTSSLRELSPNYISEDVLLELSTFSPLYLSNGADYKLLSLAPVDLPFVKQKYPKMIDSANRGYGLWTKGASHW